MPASTQSARFELLRETTIPILSNYPFEAGGDKLSLTATDLDLSLRTSCNAKVKKIGWLPGISTSARRLLLVLVL